MTYRLDAADIASPVPLGHGLWSRSQLPAELGACSTDICRVDQGLTLAYTCYRPNRDLLECSNVQRDGRTLTLTVTLEGESSTTVGTDQRFDFIAGHSTVSSFASIRGERRFPAQRTIRQLRLIADAALLRRYRLDALLDAGGDEQAARQLFFGEHSAAVLRYAQALTHLHDHDAGLLDVQIAALSLLAEQTRNLLPPAPVAGQLREADQQRILHARELLQREYSRPLTIAWLCATVGTNEFKLKQGFRTLFGTSPYRMLTEIRMRNARDLLHTGLHVSTVAYRVGYQHVSSFSAAFARHFGCAPTSLSRRHKRG